jgi:hypothetical protein
MAKEKTKIRYNFAEDAKRTRNQIKQGAWQATKIKPKDAEIESYSDVIMPRKIVFNERELLKDLLNKEKMKKAITM